MSKIEPDPEPLLLEPLPKLELAPEFPELKYGFGVLVPLELLLGGVEPPRTGAVGPEVAPDGVPEGVAGGELAAGALSLSVVCPKLTCAQHHPATTKASRQRR